MRAQVNGESHSAGPAPAWRSSAQQAEVLVAACRDRTVLASGFLAGVCVFFAPIVVLAFGLLAAYLVYVASDGTTRVFALGQPLQAADFRAIFAPAITHFPVLLSAGVAGAILAEFRRRLALRVATDTLVAGTRRLFPEYALLYVLLVGLTLGFAAAAGGAAQVHRLLGAAPVYLFFMIGATWFAHAIWQYCFRNLIDLLSSAHEREAAVALRTSVRLPRMRGRHV